MKAQLSAEMIILVAVILAVVAIVALSLTKTAGDTSSAVENQSEHITGRTGEIVGNFSSAPSEAPAMLSPGLGG